MKNIIGGYQPKKSDIDRACPPNLENTRANPKKEDTEKLLSQINIRWGTCNLVERERELKTNCNVILLRKALNDAMAALLMNGLHTAGNAALKAIEKSLE